MGSNRFYTWIHAWIALALLAMGASSYDEVYDEAGNPRPGYEEILPSYQRLSDNQKEKFRRVTKRDFKKDNALDPLPRILTRGEYETLKQGVEQRGTALRAFLKDYFAGNKAEIEKIFPKAVLDRIVARSKDASWVGKVDPATIAFPYGPDIIRDKKGVWRVIEDNPGYIGGPGDLIHARQVLFDRMPEYSERIQPINSPEQFYKNLIDRYRALANPPGGKVVLYSVPPYPDNEDSRLTRIFKDLGVETITPNTKRRLTIKSDGVWVGNEPVGFIALNSEHHFTDYTHPVAYERALIEEAKGHLGEKALSKKGRAAITEALKPDPATGKIDLKRLRNSFSQSNFRNEITETLRYQAPGLVQAMLGGRVATNYTPGLDFIGDKEFYVYVEDIIRHYLKEEPVVKNIPTGRFGVVKADKKILNQVFSDPKRYVIKAVDGRGGDAVWVGAKIPEKDFRAAQEKILADPARFIFQEYTPLSVVGDKIVDLRMISAVDQAGVLVSETPWGRALPIQGDGKVNLSSKGREMTVVVIENPSPCVQGFKAVARAKRE